MSYALNPMPGTNNARGYQNISENSLNQYGNTAGQLENIGQGLSAGGTANASMWGNNAKQMFGLAKGIASREPSWYADRAAVTSNQAFDESKGVQDRALSRMGINPNSGRFVGLQTQWGLARAAAEAGAKTRASQDAENTAFGRQQALMNQAQQGEASGRATAMQGASLIGQAGSDYNQLAGSYDRLATDKAMNDAKIEADRQNETQSKFDKMLADIQLHNASRPSGSSVANQFQQNYVQRRSII